MSAPDVDVEKIAAEIADRFSTCKCETCTTHRGIAVARIAGRLRSLLAIGRAQGLREAAGMLPHHEHCIDTDDCLGHVSWCDGQCAKALITAAAERAEAG